MAKKEIVTIQDAKGEVWKGTLVSEGVTGGDVFKGLLTGGFSLLFTDTDKAVVRVNGEEHSGKKID